MLNCYVKTDSVLAEVRMPSTVAGFHQARKERLERIKLAAFSLVKVASEPEATPNPVGKTRREYRSNDRPSAFVPTARRILRAVSFEFNVSIEDITGPSRLQEFVLPRFVAIGLAVELTRMSFPAMGQWLGNRDHSSIFNGKKRILSLLEGEAFRNRFDQIKAEIAGI